LRRRQIVNHFSGHFVARASDKFRAMQTKAKPEASVGQYGPIFLKSALEAFACRPGALISAACATDSRGAARADALDDPETTQRDERAFIFRLMQVHSGAEICNLGTMVRSGN
jgi:hypothetical protein